MSNFESHVRWPAFYVGKSAGGQREGKDLLHILQLAGAEVWLSLELKGELQNQDKSPVRQEAVRSRKPQF